MFLTFLGAIGTVTGSKTLVETQAGRVLVDCGLFQGRRSESREKNARLPLPVQEIDAVILSHAHIDHCGKIPLLVKQGFKGKIFSTHATRDLAAIMLMDTAHILQKDAEYHNRKFAERGRRNSHEQGGHMEPLYTANDVVNAMNLFIAVIINNLEESKAAQLASLVKPVTREEIMEELRATRAALHRLEDRAWLQAEWKATETGREAKFYALTRKGRKQMEAEIRNWEQISNAVALILRTAG